MRTDGGCRFVSCYDGESAVFLQRLRVNPVDDAVYICCQSAAPAGTVTDLGKVDGAFAGRVALPGTAPAGQANLLAGVQIGEVAEQAHVLAPGAVIKAQAECPGLFGALVLLQVGLSCVLRK